MMSSIPACKVPSTPLAPGGALRDLAAIAQMLEQGWRIETPVLARLSWAQRRWPWPPPRASPSSA